MAALHDLHWDFLFSCQKNCKQHIILNHVFFRYKSNLKPVTCQTYFTITSRIFNESCWCGFMSVSWKVHKNSSRSLWVAIECVRNLIEYCNYVTIETTYINIHTNYTIVSEGEDNIYFPWKFYEDWLNSFWVLLQYVRWFDRALQLGCHRNNTDWYPW